MCFIFLTKLTHDFTHLVVDYNKHLKLIILIKSIKNTRSTNSRIFIGQTKNKKVLV